MNIEFSLIDILSVQKKDAFEISDVFLKIFLRQKMFFCYNQFKMSCLLKVDSFSWHDMPPSSLPQSCTYLNNKFYNLYNDTKLLEWSLCHYYPSYVFIKERIWLPASSWCECWIFTLYVHSNNNVMSLFFSICLDCVHTSV